jgi:hypothetical protein
VKKHCLVPLCCFGNFCWFFCLVGFLPLLIKIVLIFAFLFLEKKFIHLKAFIVSKINVNAGSFLVFYTSKLKRSWQHFIVICKLPCVGDSKNIFFFTLYLHLYISELLNLSTHCLLNCYYHKWNNVAFINSFPKGNICTKWVLLPF